MISRLRRLALAAGMCAALAGAASAQAAIFDDAEARARIEELRHRLDAHQRASEEGLVRIEASAANAADRRAILDLAGQIDGLRAEMANVRGQVEVLLHQLQTAAQRQKDP